jgi:hypothetical protein
MRRTPESAIVESPWSQAAELRSQCDFNGGIETETALAHHVVARACTNRRVVMDLQQGERQGTNQRVDAKDQP